MHKYINGQKAFSFQFTDKEELPLPARSFELVKIAQNMRGMFTDLQIFSSYYDDDEMVSWTTSCNSDSGDIIDWNKNKIFIQDNDDEPRANLIAVDKKDVCPGDSKPTPRQKAKETMGAERVKRYKKTQVSGSFVNAVLAHYFDETLKDNMDCVDQCQRFGGDLMTFPQHQVLSQIITIKRLI